MENMRNKLFAKASAMSMLLGILIFVISAPTQSKEPLDDAADFDRLMEAVAYGDKLWHTGGGAGGKNPELCRKR